MPFLGTPFSIDRLLGLHLFDSALSHKLPPASAPSQAASEAKKRPAAASSSTSSSSSSSASSITTWSTHSLSSALSLLGLIAHNAVPSLSSPVAASSPSPPVATWPMAQLPVEIFEIITKYLTRADVKALRLVCREFEAKVSAHYFRNVVVPFRSELYTNLDPDENNAITSRLFSNGMRIFESFGPHILRFALSLELDEFTLAYPPVKPAQEAVAAFWGVYRWPHETYHRYTDLEGLEQTADETDSMKRALRCLTKVTNLGLCCDAGLGFLVGPDQAARKLNNRDPVFDAQDWHQDVDANEDDSLAAADFNVVPRDLASATAQHDTFKRRVLEKMISDAGFAGYYVHEAIDLLLETEGVSISNIDFDEREVTLDEQQQQQQEQQQQQQQQQEGGGGEEPLQGLRRVQPRRIRRRVRALAQLMQQNRQALLLHQHNHPPQPLVTHAPPLHVHNWLGLPAPPGDGGTGQLFEDDHDEDDDSDRDQPPPPEANSRQPLIPTNLTRAQKELLLELEWAHRAMIQSYVISIIDNAGDGCFRYLTNVTIAKIPSAHIHILCRRELWQSIPSVKNVSLGVIADWRKITKPSPGVVEDIHVSPVEAVSKVYRLLNDYIGQQPNIQNLHFEWICGGEFARGPYQRNLYVLPAPIVETPDLMIATDGAKHVDKLLHLPHVKHFSLKNCWASPHLLLQTLRTMALRGLDKLELESVSITGQPVVAPPQTAPPADDIAHPLAAFFPGLAGPIPLQPIFPPVQMPFIMADETLAAERLAIPDTLTWLGLCDHFSPSIKMRLLSYFEDSPTLNEDGSKKGEDLSPFLPNADTLKADEARYTLSNISFKSCGYVYVDARTLDARPIMPNEGQVAHSLLAGGHRDMFHSMQYCKDKLLGRIIPFLPLPEMRALEQVFLMEQGWLKVYSDQICDEAIADGLECPGLGRFSGSVDKTAETDIEIKIRRRARAY